MSEKVLIKLQQSYKHPSCSTATLPNYLSKCVLEEIKSYLSNHILFIHLRDFPVVTGPEAGCNVNQSQTQKKK